MARPAPAVLGILNSSSGPGRSAEFAWELFTMGKAVLAILQFLARCVLYSAIGAIVGGVLFLPFGLLGWILTKEVAAVLFPSGFGGLLGTGFGIGQVFIEYFSERPPEQERAGGNLAGNLAEFYLGPLKPDWLVVFDIARWFATTDFSKQKPGRWKRALIGAIGLSLIAAFLLGFAALNAPVRGPDAPLLGALAAMLVVPAAVIGAVVGALSDSL